MSLVRYYNPFKELQRNFDRFFDNNTHLAPLDLIESEEEFTIQIDLPGFSKEDVSIEADYEHITITAEYADEKEDQDESDKTHYLLKERVSNKLSRSVKFRTPINASGAETSLENGVLTIKVPKAEEAKSVKLSIN
ncbi:MAG: Hsp20/alpha crystallin family protein [Candidatus Kariarchaeaceae archaeon]|jgi:HSP20 family protein